MSDPDLSSPETAVLLSVGGVPVLLHGIVPFSSVDFGPAYDVFRTTGDPQVIVELAWVDHLELPSDLPEPVFQSECLWQLHRVGTHWVFVLSLLEPPFTPYRIATFDDDFTRGSIVSTRKGRLPTIPERLPNPLEYPLGEALTIGLLGTGRGLMVHALGVERDGRGVLFCGHSGQGKSTLAGLFSGRARILNDDRIIVRLRDGIPWIHGTPWHGDCSAVSAGGAPLSGLYFIEHDRVDRVFGVRPAVASAMLLARSFPPIWSRRGMDFSLGFIERIVQAVPCARLGFTPTPAVLDLLP